MNTNDTGAREPQRCTTTTAMLAEWRDRGGMRFGPPPIPGIPPCADDACPVHGVIAKGVTELIDRYGANGARFKLLATLERVGREVEREQRVKNARHALRYRALAAGVGEARPAPPPCYICGRMARALAVLRDISPHHEVRGGWARDPFAAKARELARDVVALTEELERLAGVSVSGSPDECACGALLVACDKCGDSRCLNCDPYDERDTCAPRAAQTRWRLARRVGELLAAGGLSTRRRETGGAMNDLVQRLANALETAAGQYGQVTDEQRNEWMQLVEEARSSDEEEPT